MAGAGVTFSVSAETDRCEWDSYVRAQPHGSVFHLAGWCEAAREAYGYEPVYITARRAGALAGVLPLVDVASPLLGRSLVSTAFTVGGGPLGDDEAVRRALLACAEAEGRARRVRYVECRCADAVAPGWIPKRGAHAQFQLALSPDDDSQLGAVPRKRRADIRKALEAEEKGCLSVRYDNDVEGFYRLYASALHAHGTPVYPKKYLYALMREFSNEVEIATVDYQGAPAAALLSFYHHERVAPYYIGTGSEARKSRAHDFIYWSVMRRAARRGCRVFDFGRSRIGVGAYAYKKHWGAQERPVVYAVKLLSAHQAPNVSPGNPAFAVFSKAWPRLPQFAADALGPLLAPNFP